MRAQTGFAIGGVSPVGHLTPPTCFIVSHLMQFQQLWAAAGTPNDVFLRLAARFTYGQRCKKSLTVVSEPHDLF
ncbi:MAG: hypothetical protein JXQ88_15135 [Shimia sp.]